MEELERLEKAAGELRGGSLEIYTQAAAFYVACLKNGFLEEATEFQEWFLETFDIDLED